LWSRATYATKEREELAGAPLFAFFFMPVSAITKQIGLGS
jgi:hypothetical protein